MKSSKTVTLVLMGASSVALAACDATPKGGVFSGPAECFQAGVESDVCKNVFEQSLQTHLAKAPRFATLQECQAASDSECQASALPSADGAAATSFIPVMGGYTVQTADNCGDDGDACPTGNSSHYYTGGYHGYYGSPIYGSRSYAGASRPLSAFFNRPARPAASGYSYAAPKSNGSARVYNLSRPAMSTGTVSRGGFGRGGSFGGGRSGGS